MFRIYFELLPSFYESLNSVAKSVYIVYFIVFPMCKPLTFAIRVNNTV